MAEQGGAEAALGSARSNRRGVCSCSRGEPAPSGVGSDDFDLRADADDTPVADAEPFKAPAAMESRRCGAEITFGTAIVVGVVVGSEQKKATPRQTPAEAGD